MTAIARKNVSHLNANPQTQELVDLRGQVQSLTDELETGRQTIAVLTARLDEAGRVGDNAEGAQRLWARANAEPLGVAVHLLVARVVNALPVSWGASSEPAARCLSKILEGLARTGYLQAAWCAQRNDEILSRKRAELQEQSGMAGEIPAAQERAFEDERTWREAELELWTELLEQAKDAFSAELGQDWEPDPKLKALASGSGAATRATPTIPLAEVMKQQRRDLGSI